MAAECTDGGCIAGVAGCFGIAMTGVEVVLSAAAAGEGFFRAGGDGGGGSGALVSISGATPVKHDGAVISSGVISIMLDDTHWSMFFRGGTTIGIPPPRREEISHCVGGAIICGFHDIS